MLLPGDKPKLTVTHHIHPGQPQCARCTTHSARATHIALVVHALSSFPAFGTASWPASGPRFNTCHRFHCLSLTCHCLFQCLSSVRLGTFYGQNAAQSTQLGEFKATYAGGYKAGPLAIFTVKETRASTALPHKSCNHVPLQRLCPLHRFLMRGCGIRGGPSGGAGRGVAALSADELHGGRAQHRPGQQRAAVRTAGHAWDCATLFFLDLLLPDHCLP